MLMAADLMQLLLAANMCGVWDGPAKKEADDAALHQMQDTALHHRYSRLLHAASMQPTIFRLPARLYCMPKIGQTCRGWYSRGAQINEPTNSHTAEEAMHQER